MGKAIFIKSRMWVLNLSELEIFCLHDTKKIFVISRIKKFMKPWKNFMLIINDTHAWLSNEINQSDCNFQ